MFVELLIVPVEGILFIDFWVIGPVDAPVGIYFEQAGEIVDVPPGGGHLDDMTVEFEERDAAGGVLEKMQEILT